MHSILYSLMDPRNSIFNTEFLADAFMIISSILLEGIYIYIYLKNGKRERLKYLSYGFRLHQVFFFFFFKWNREKISMKYKDNELDASLKIYGF